jgi:hypothetical protein
MNRPDIFDSLLTKVSGTPSAVMPGVFDLDTELHNPRRKHLPITSLPPIKGMLMRKCILFHAHAAGKVFRSI